MKRTINNKVVDIIKESKVTRLGCFLNKNIAIIACMLVLGIMLTSVASATAQSLWDEVSNLIETWVTRLGGVVMFVGGVMFGLGWKSDDAEQKSRGISTLVAGAIVVAVATLTSTFFA